MFFPCQVEAILGGACMHSGSISSGQNPRIKKLIKLRKKRERDISGQYLIEGYRELSRAYGGKADLMEIYYCETLFLGESEHSLLEKLFLKGKTLYSLSEQVFKKISYRDRPDGLLALARQDFFSLQDFETNFSLSDRALFVVAQAIEKPGNLGSILRSCDAVGATALFVCDQCTDLFNPNVVRSSVGTLFTLPVVQTTSCELISWLKQKNIQIVSATPHAELLYNEVDMTHPTAIVVGTEQYGLSKHWLEKDLKTCRIPMRGMADSLNVATATTVLLYEVLRQRQSR